MTNEDRQALAQRLAHLPQQRKEVLHRLMKQAERSGALGPRLSNVPVPLSYAQQRLWLLDRLRPGNSAYNEANFLRFPYAVDADALRRAVAEIVRRHEALRTSFPIVDHEPVQQIARNLDVEIPLRDLRQLPPAQREAEALRLAADEARVPFDIANGPLFRASLYCIGDSEYLFALTLHHLICDGWSMGVFSVELMMLYWSFVTNQPSPLPPPSLQYGDFALWQRKNLDEALLAPQLAYWRRQLAGAPVVELPADRPRPAEFSFRGARQPLHIADELFRSLVGLAQREGVTLFMLLLAGFYVLLHRYTGQSDLTVGSPVSGRNRTALEPLIGCFINTMVLRGDLSGDPPFVELLSRVRDTVLSGFTNQDVPFERLIQELQLPRDKSRNPLFQISFQLFQQPSAAGLRKDILLPFIPLEAGLAKFDLTAEMIWTESEVKGHVEFNTDLFEPERIARLIEHYGVLLAGIVADPQQRLSDLPLMTAAERETMLTAWNQTAVDYPRDGSIVGIFAAIAAAMPEAPAVSFGKRTLSFAELDRQSDKIADTLTAHGARRGEPVGLHLERCLELPASMLGILKCGAAFAPLDPTYPRERLAYMLRDSGVKFVLTHDKLASGAAELGAAALTVEAALAHAGDALPREAPSAGDLAYLMYTSGTTGRPKGVAVTHRNILRTVMGTRTIRLERGAAILQFAPISFDASTFEIWGSLLNGCRLAIHPPHLPTLEELGTFIRDNHIDTAFLTTGLFRQIVESCPGLLRNMRQLITGGEVMPVAAIKAAWAALPRTRILHAYGPTECTTFATLYPVEDPEAIGTTVPIGHPIENTTAYILDAYGNPAPIGIPGELYIGGDGVAQGYWRQPELTAQRFLPDPFRTVPGDRLYRTGDIACYRADGNILFLGRRDRQVKINGFRIELGEVEAVIEGHPDVASAAVLRTAGDTPHLTGFAEAARGSALSASALRDYLAERLPSHMVPAQLEILEHMPLSAVGKIDRDALMCRADRTVTGRGANEPPRNATESRIAELWEELLNVERVGIADNFFELGGHSLAATRLLSRVRQHFAAEVSMQQFFDEPTVAGLAAAVASSIRSAP